MDTIDRARHELEVAAVSERKLRLQALQLAVQALGPGKSTDVAPLASTFLNFLIGNEDRATKLVKSVVYSRDGTGNFHPSTADYLRNAAAWIEKGGFPFDRITFSD